MLFYFIKRYTNCWIENPILSKRLQNYINKTCHNKLSIDQQSFFIQTIYYCNNIYYMAPISKWLLTLVPLIIYMPSIDEIKSYWAPIDSNAIKPMNVNNSIDKIDLNTSLSLAITGAIWCIYALLIRPQNIGSRSLAAANFSMAVVNGYNALKKYKYNRSN